MASSDVKAGDIVLVPLTTDQDEKKHAAEVQYNWQDGQKSIEEHLRLYVGDLMNLIAAEKDIGTASTIAAQRPAGTEDASASVLHQELLILNFTFQNRIHGKLSSFPVDLCSNLATVLFHVIQQTEPGFHIKPQTTKSSELALRTFLGFLEDVKEFQDVIEERSAVELRDFLKLHRHLRSSNEEHRLLTIRLLDFLATNFDKFSDWKELIKSDYHGDVEEIRPLLRAQMKTDPFRVRPDHLPPRGHYFDTREERVLNIFKTSLEQGLTQAEAKKRLDYYGPNDLPTPPKPSLIWMLLKQFMDFIVVLLMIAAIVSAIIGDHESTIVLFLVVIINGTIGFVQEYRAERALEALASLRVPQATVLREGREENIDARQLVPGDIVVLDEGASVPADLRMVEVAQLQIMEAILTGESVGVFKTTPALRVKRRPPLGDRTNTAFMSTLVIKGRGKGVVVNTGATTEVGKISAAILGASIPKTPLQVKLERLGKFLVLVSLVACALIIVIGIARGYGSDIVKAGISLAISVVPEGLVTVVTLTMALGMQRMAASNAIVRKLPAVETLGEVTTICSDKTGTLTEGKMKTEMIWSNGEQLRFSGVGITLDQGEAFFQDAPVMQPMQALPTPLQLALMATAVCNNSSVIKEEDGNWKPVGDSTEVALFVSAHRARASKTTWLSTLGLTFLLEFAFDSDRKRMSSVYRMGDALKSSGSFCGIPIPTGASHLLVAKGASEAIVPQCTHHVTSAAASSSAGDTAGVGPAAPAPTAPAVDEKEASGQKFAARELDAPAARLIEREGDHMAHKGMRVLALAIRFVTDAEISQWEEAQKAAVEAANAKPSAAGAGTGAGAAVAPTVADPSHVAECQLMFVGLAGIMDPPRESVKKAIVECHQAGVRVVMITGDHAATALAIARQIGIVPANSSDVKVVNGANLAAMSEEQLTKLSPFPCVFSRVSPDNKLKIVRALQSMKEVVAMTGDGVNDAAAIKQADVGIAMGLSGTEITRQAADVVLADDNFGTIVTAVEEGRRIFDNIIKFNLYLLSCNSSEVFIMLICVAAGLPVPLTSIMILWANIFADVPPSISLGVEPAEEDIMQRNPRNPDDGVLSLLTGTLVLLNGLIIALLCLFIYCWALYIDKYSDAYARSVAFMGITSIHLSHAFHCRSISTSIFVKGMLSNRGMVWGVSIALVLLILGFYVPGLNHLLELEPVAGKEVGKVLILHVIHFSFIELEKLLIRHMKWA